MNNEVGKISRNRGQKIMQSRECSLDVIKIIATILIVFHHYQQVTGAMFEKINFWDGKFYFGNLVELFFVLSGYFMWRYVDKIDATYSFKSFILRKVQRLLPLVAIGAVAYEILVLIYQLVYQRLWFDTNVTLWGTIIDALGIQDGWGLANPGVNNPTWYISVLIWCNIVFFSLTRLSKCLKIPYYYFYIFMILVGMGISTYGINLPFFNSSMARGYYAFFFGVLLGLYCNKRKVTTRMNIICLSVLFLLLILIVFQYDIVAMGINYIMTFVFYPAVIIVFNSALAKKVFRFSIIGIIGKVSYDVYIWHVPMLLVMYIFIKISGCNVNINSWKTMFLFTFLTFIVGAISYFGIERPIDRVLKSKL